MSPAHRTEHLRKISEINQKVFIEKTEGKLKKYYPSAINNFSCDVERFIVGCRGVLQLGGLVL